MLRLIQFLVCTLKSLQLLFDFGYLLQTLKSLLHLLTSFRFANKYLKDRLECENLEFSVVNIIFLFSIFMVWITT